MEKHPFILLKELEEKQRTGSYLTDAELESLELSRGLKDEEDAIDLSQFKRRKYLGMTEIQCYTYFDYDGKPISMWEWGYLYSKNRHVGKDTINKMHISTVWLGMAHGFRNGCPVIYETMIFDDSPKENKSDLDEYQERYCTYSEALEGHEQAIKLVMSSI